MILWRILCVILIVICFFNTNYSQSSFKQDSILADRYYELGEHFFLEQGQKDSSIYYLNKAYKLYKKLGLWHNALGTKNWCAYIFHSIQKPDSILFYLSQTKEVRDSLSYYNPNDMELATYANYMAAYYNLKDNLFQKTVFHAKALNILEGQANPDSTKLSLFYKNISYNHGILGDYYKAIQFSTKALELYKPTELRAKILVLDSLAIINALATYHFKINDIEKAKAYYKKAEDLVDKLPSSVLKNKSLPVLVYRNLGQFFQEQKQYEQAQLYFEKAIQLAENHEGKLHIRYLISTLRGLGQNYYYQNNDELVFSFLDRALSLSIENYGQKSTLVAKNYKVLGDCHQNQAEKALYFYQKALVASVPDFNDSLNFDANPDIQENVGAKMELLELIFAKAKTLQQLNKKQAALNTYQLAIDILEDLRLNYLTEASKFFLQEKYMSIFENAIAVALELGEKEKAFEFMERSKAALLLENISEVHAKLIADIPDSLLQQERALQLQIAHYQTKIAENQNTKKDIIKEYQARLFDLRRTYDQFKEKLEEQFPKYSQLKNNNHFFAVKDIQKKLLDKEIALLEFFVGEDHIFIFSLRQKNLNVYTLPQSIELTSSIQQLSNTLTNPSNRQQDFKTFATHGFYLYQQLLEKALEQLNKKINQLIIIPDGQLGYIPFQCLLRYPLDMQKYTEPRYDTLSYLVKDFAFSYGYSSSFLMEMANRKSLEQEAKHNFGGFAPSFPGKIDDVRGGGEVLDSLLFNMKEVILIDSIVDGLLYLSDDANVLTFKQTLQDFKILHLATHATIDDEFPLDSRIHFSDNYINTRQIYNLPLQAKLAVLSACKTASGKLRRGEGIMSLARAFTYAGCPSLMTSLWEVDDQTSTHLMVDFYENLSKGQQKNEAIARTQREYLAQSSYTKAHPYYWATFIQIGDTQAVFEHTHSVWIWIAIGIALLIFLILFSWIQFRHFRE